MIGPRRALLTLFVASVSFAAAPPPAPVAPAGPPVPAKIDFTRDVRPILVSRCFTCHGPDEATRKAKLRLDLRGAAVAKARSGNVAIVPAHPARSELISRIKSTDESDRMPPRKAGKALSRREIAILEAWIKQGAPYSRHWAYIAPVRPALPAVKQGDWGRTPLDRLVLARLEKEKLKPAPQAGRYTLAPRLHLDLTGLPPTIEEADTFVNDKRPGAYERLVDRVLASPAFGERWALPWLDLARYADSQGYANDPDRAIWPWRDWVVRAFNANLPYDRFTIEQLAGDLLPRPTTDQLIATGFHRNTLTNTEGGTNAEEFRTAAVVDRVNTTFQVWLGTTMACAQCHTHKYDPFSQKEYYGLYAIFNNTEDANFGNDQPTLTLAHPGTEKEHATLTTQVASLRKSLAELTRKLDGKQAAWEKTVDRTRLPKNVVAVLAVAAAKRNGGQKNLLLAHHRGLSKEYRDLEARVKTAGGRLRQITATTPILREIKPRPAHVLIRGNFLDRGEAVAPGLPASLPGLPRGTKVDRLALARWLVRADNPLTARVAVNRFWEELFGIGLVETSEDFGTQGELPSHPELLDWLAVEFRESGWDVKGLLRLLVSSATYRQSAKVSAALARRDPNNRLLARGPRPRLSAEAIRDQALFAGGLLSRKSFGPPVQPPRPRLGLSAAFGSSTDWATSAGDDRFRRGLYIRWRRNAPYPSLSTFDAPERTTCTSRRVRTNTPLQALVTLNDPVFVEAAQALARRVLREGGKTTRERIVHAFRLALTRPPTEAEAARLERLFGVLRKRYAASPAAARTMATKPLGPAPAGMDVLDLAAWTVVGNVLLNLDETLARR